MATARTIQDVIDRALRILHVIRADETPQTADRNTALIALQDMLADWVNDGLVIPAVTQEHFTLTVGEAIYTIGEGSYALILDANESRLFIDNTAPDYLTLREGEAVTKDTVRPEYIVGAFVLDSSSYSHPVEIIVEDQYIMLSDKSEAGRPDKVWVSYTSPNVTFHMHPVPDTAEEFYYYCNKPFIEPSLLSQDLLDDIQIPRSYHKAITDNLAVELADEYGAQVSPMRQVAAIRGKSVLMSASAARRVGPTVTEFSVMGGGYSLSDFFAGR